MKQKHASRWFARISTWAFVCMLMLSVTLMAQNVDDLRKNKEKAETQLRETNRALQKNLP